MEFTPVEVINQIVAWFAITILEIVFVVRDAPVRSHMVLRFISGNLAGIVFVMLYFPYYQLARMPGINMVETIMIYLWWGIFHFFTILLIWSWFDISFGQLLLRCIMGLCLYYVGNTLIQNFISGLWLPELGEKDPFLYFVLYVLCYLTLGSLGYFLFARNMGAMKNLYGMDTPMMYGFLLLVLFFSNIVWDISNGIFKHALQPLLNLGQHSAAINTVQYFCAFTSIVFSLFVMGILFLFYRISYLRQEESMLKYLQAEKEKQYEYYRQNIDVINQKCHDLKRQIQALRFSDDTEKEKLYQETQSAADFFDYIVKTDNDMLNTILTEKGLICHSKRIRLTCTVQDCAFDNIPVIDLYTMLSNALDNAIECVEKYEEEEKKIISVHISMVGTMNCIMIENYFDGQLQYENGQLATSKEDKDFHGFGVRSIQMIARKYKGSTRISHTNHTFSIQILIPS